MNINKIKIFYKLKISSKKCNHQSILLWQILINPIEHRKIKYLTNTTSSVGKLLVTKRWVIQPVYFWKMGTFELGRFYKLIKKGICQLFWLDIIWFLNKYNSQYETFSNCSHQMSDSIYLNNWNKLHYIHL